MVGVSLHEVAILLAALAIAGPLARWLGINEVLGYLVVGLLLGPHTIGWSFSDYEAKEILHFAEFGIVLLLFLIGLELRPKRLWAMRNAVFVLGTEQVLLTGAVLPAIGLLVGFSWQTAVFVGLALALSSTALALQVMEETGDLNTRHGRLGFSVLLFQDLAAIPLIAFAPMFAAHAISTASSVEMDVIAVLKGLGLIAVIVVVGHFVLDYFRRSADHRLLFGGRVSYSGLDPLNTERATRARMIKVFPQLADARIEYAWGGYVDITMSRAPDFGRLAANV